MNLLEAIAREEGFNNPKSRAGRNHNPGNIRYTPLPHGFAPLHGALGHDDAGFAIFATDAQGFASLRALLSAPTYKGHTIAQAIARYAPNNENDTSAYVKNVSTWMGVSADTVIDSLLG